jgi:transcriptional regulator with XRE-family HTH domain
VAGVGEKLRELRTQREWSTRKLAAELGVSQPMVSNYERGVTKISADDLPRIADIFGVRPSVFYGEEERPLTMAEIIRGLEALARSHDDHDGDPSRLPARRAGDPASDGGHLEGNRMLSEAELRKSYWTVAHRATPARAHARA